MCICTGNPSRAQRTDGEDVGRDSQGMGTAGAKSSQIEPGTSTACGHGEGYGGVDVRERRPKGSRMCLCYKCSAERGSGSIFAGLFKSQDTIFLALRCEDSTWHGANPSERNRGKRKQVPCETTEWVRQASREWSCKPRSPENSSTENHCDTFCIS